MANDYGLQLTPAQQNQSRIAQALQGQALSNQPIYSPWQVAGRLAMAYAGKQQQDQLEQSQQARRQAMAQTLQNAIAAAQPGAGSSGGPSAGQNPMTASQRMADVLAGNTDTAGMGTELAMKQATAAPADHYGPLLPLGNGQYIQRNQTTGQADILGSKGGVTVNNNMGGGNEVSSEANKKYGGGIGDQAIKRLKTADQAKTADAQLDRVKLALNRGAKVGFGQDTLLKIKKFGQTFLGLDLPDTASEQEIIRQVGNRLALKARNPNSGMGLPGQTSNKDIEFLKSIVPNLEKTRRGLLKIIDMNKRINKYHRDLAAKQQQIIDANGGSIPANLDSRLMKYADNYRFFTPAERKQISQVAGQPGKSIVPDNTGDQGGDTGSSKPVSEMSDEEVLKAAGVQ